MVSGRPAPFRPINLTSGRKPASFPNPSWKLDETPVASQTRQRSDGGLGLFKHYASLTRGMTFYTKPISLLAIAWWFAATIGWAQPPAVDPAEPTAVSPQAESQAASSSAGFEYSFPALGTLVSLTAFSDDQSLVEQSFAEAETLVRRLEAILTDYDPASETRQLNTTAVAAPAQVSDELWQVLQASDAWYHRTAGAFDAGLGAVTHLWRRSRQSRQPPPAELLAQALSHSGWSQIRLDAQAKTIHLLDPAVKLDFGAIGKGYIVDRVFDHLVADGLACSLVNISGNMRCGTPPAGREGWRIAISPLEKDGPPLRHVLAANTAVATSGDLWQYMLVDGKRRSHIIDPRTGQGVPGPVAATVIAQTATDADAMATAACVLGARRGLELALKLEDVELLFATKIPSDSPDSPDSPAPLPAGAAGAAGTRVASLSDGEDVLVITTPGFPGDTR